MNLSHSYYTTTSSNPLHSCPSFFLPIACSFKNRALTPKTHTSSSTTRQIRPRDRAIDFGKHKGKMLGTLPSGYLKWVSDNLRARDFEDWAKLADQVLQDPIYKDRVEWEFAEKVLNGNQIKALSFPQKEQSSTVAELTEISERFGWDYKDKEGWSKVKFEDLGTSNGGRIPRINGRKGQHRRDLEMGVKKNEQKKDIVLSSSRERTRRRLQEQRIRREGSNNRSESKMEIKEKVRGIVNEGNDDQKEEDEYDGGLKIYNPFPGREAVLKKVINNRRFL